MRKFTCPICEKRAGWPQLLTATELSGSLITSRQHRSQSSKTVSPELLHASQIFAAGPISIPTLALHQARTCDAQAASSRLMESRLASRYLDTFDMPTTYGSTIYKDFQPTMDTAAVGLMRRAGMVILGKLQDDGIRQPRTGRRAEPPRLHQKSRRILERFRSRRCRLHDAAGPRVADRGSTILPAAFCGVVGYKASLTDWIAVAFAIFGRLSTPRGLFARSIADIAILRSVLSGVELSHAFAIFAALASASGGP